MTRDNSMHSRFEVPWEVIDLIGHEFLASLDDTAKAVTLETLEEMHKEKGLQGIRDKATMLTSQLEQMKMFRGTPCRQTCTPQLVMVPQAHHHRYRHIWASRSWLTGVCLRKDPSGRV